MYKYVLRLFRSVGIKIEDSFYVGMSIGTSGMVSFTFEECILPLSVVLEDESGAYILCLLVLVKLRICVIQHMLSSMTKKGKHFEEIDYFGISSI